MWELDYKESWAPKNWCFWTAVLEKMLESPLNCKEIKPVNPKGNPSWIFIGSIDAEAEVPILWPPDGKNWRTGTARDAGEDGRQEEKGTTEDEMVGWHHQLDGHKFEQASGVGDGQGILRCYSPWGRKGSDSTERRNWAELTENYAWQQLQATFKLGKTSELCNYIEKFSVTGKCADIMNTKQSIPYKETLICLIIWIILIVWIRKKISSFVSSVQFSRSVMSDSLQPHRLHHARPPCPTATPRACSNSCPLSQWCHPNISIKYYTTYLENLLHFRSFRYVLSRHFG